MNADIFAIALLFLTLAIGIRLLAGGMDKERIQAYFEQRGVRVLEVSWAPLGPGWFGQGNSRIYSVHYVDERGDEHEAHCKTSLFAGVYTTEDRVVRTAAKPSETSELEA